MYKTWSLALLSLVLAAPACGASSEPLATEVWLELGWGDPFEPFDDGDVLAMTIGSQGARMFPLAVRTGGFEPERDKAATDGPMLDLVLVTEPDPISSEPPFELVVEAMPIDLREQTDGTRLFYYVPLIVEEGVDLVRVDDESAELDAELRLGSLAAAFSVLVVLEGVSS